MANVSATGGRVNQEGSKGQPAATIALSASAAIGAFLLLLAPVFSLTSPVTADLALAEPQKQSAESALFLVGFLVIVPLVVFLVPKLVARVDATPNRDARDGLVGLTAIGLAGIVAVTRTSALVDSGGGLWVLFALTLLWLVFFGLAWFRAAKGDLPGRAWLDDHSTRLGWIAWAGTIVAVFCIGYPSHIDPAWLFAGLLAGAVVLRVWYAGHDFSVGRRSGRILDLLILMLVLLAVPDLVIMRSPLETGLPGGGFSTFVMQGHEALFLGVLSQVHQGSVLLVDTVSQYGIGSIYLLAAWFELVPMNNGTLALFDAGLSALMFAGGYAILRISGVGRLLAASALAVAVVTLVYGLLYPVGGLLQHGGLRFGLPVPLILFWVAATRFERGRTAWNLAGWAVIGLSSIWALEAFMYVTGAAVSMIALRAAVAEPEERISTLVKGAVAMVLAWTIVQVAFALATLAASGELPDWGLYMTYLRDFLTGDVGDITYDIPAWSPGIAVGVAWGVAAIALITVVISNSDWLRDRRATLVALAGLTGFGICLFSYFVNRSLDHVLPYLCLPLVLVVAIWLNEILRTDRLGVLPRGAALASALAVSALAVSIVMPAASDRARSSALAHFVPGGSSPGEALRRLWNMPELVEGATSGAVLLEEYMPGETRSAVITRPDLDVAILVRADRANRFGITDAKEASWVPGPHLAVIDDAVDGFERGDRMLLDEGAYEALLELRRDPGANLDALHERTSLEPIQFRALAGIAERFREVIVARRSGFVVVELEPVE